MDESLWLNNCATFISGGIIDPWIHSLIMSLVSTSNVSSTLGHGNLSLMVFSFGNSQIHIKLYFLLTSTIDEAYGLVLSQMTHPSVTCVPAVCQNGTEEFVCTVGR